MFRTRESHAHMKSRKLGVVCSEWWWIKSLSTLLLKIFKEMQDLTGAVWRPSRILRPVSLCSYSIFRHLVCFLVLWFYLSSSGLFISDVFLCFIMWFKIRLRTGKVGGSLGSITGRREGFDCYYVADIAYIVVRHWLIVMIFSEFILGLLTTFWFLVIL